jgi:hypothetical protein
MVFSDRIRTIVIIRPGKKRNGPELRLSSDVPPGWASAAIFGILFLAVPLFAEHRLQGNLERVEQAADSAAVLCVARFHFNPGDRIQWIKSEDADPLHRLIVSRIAAALAWNGVRFTPPADPESPKGRFSLTVAGAGISYERAPSGGLESHSSVNRIAEVKVTGRFFESDSMRVDSVSVRLEDRLRRSDLDSVEAGGSLLGRPERPKPRFFARVLEPALIVASLGWMVYSFYSIRSQ